MPKDIENITTDDEYYENIEETELKSTLETIAILILLVRDNKTNLKLEITRFYNDYGVDGIITLKDAKRRLKNENNTVLLTQITLTITKALEYLVKNVYNKIEDLMNVLIKKEFDTFGTKPPEKDIDLKWGLNNKDWKQRLNDNLNKWNYYINQDLKRNIIKSKELKKVLFDLNKRYDTIENILRRLTLTESSAVRSLTREEIFKELGIKKYRYFTKADERTCEICRPLHGLVFPTSSYTIGVNAPPMHPNCRDWTIPEI